MRNSSLGSGIKNRKNYVIIMYERKKIVNYSFFFCIFFLDACVVFRHRE